MPAGPSWKTENALAFRQFLQANPYFWTEVRSAIPVIVSDKGMDIGASTGLAHGGADTIVAKLAEMTMDVDSGGDTPFIKTGTNA